MISPVIYEYYTAEILTEARVFVIQNIKNRTTIRLKSDLVHITGKLSAEVLVAFTRTGRAVSPKAR